MTICYNIDECEVVVGDEDSVLLQSFIWHVRSVGASGRPPRVVSYRREGGKLKTIQLHRAIMAGHKGHISFLNGNTLDCRRANLILHKTVASRLECPVTSDTLRQLYVDQSLSVATLTEILGKAVGRNTNVNEVAIHRWLEECGIKRRTLEEELRARNARNPEILAKARIKGVKAHVENIRLGLTIPQVEHLHTDDIKSKARSRYTAAMAERFVIQKCRRQSCENCVRRSKKQIERKPEVYCSRSCMGKDWQSAQANSRKNS